MLRSFRTPILQAVFKGNLQLAPTCYRGIFTTSYLNKTDYYDVIGVKRNATQKEIKQAYFQKAKQYHPDTNKNPDAVKKFQELAEAYDVLSDEGKRRQYDQFGMAGSSGMPPPPGSGGGGSGGFGGFNQYHANIDPEELFRKIFGEFEGSFRGGGGPFGSSGFAENIFGHGPSAEVSVQISFEDSARGCTKQISMNLVDTCPKCNGSRAEPGSKPIKCPSCNGTGMETVASGAFFMRTMCRQCRGKKTIVRNPCRECNGKGQTIQRKTVAVNIPAGIEDGQSMRLTVGKQEVFVTFRVSKSNYFRRDGPDIHTDADISIAQAVLGGTKKIKGVLGDITINIAPGTSSHAKIKLLNKGLPRLHSFGHGDHYVHLRIKVPNSMSEQQKALLMAYAELEKTEGTDTVNNMTNNNEGNYY